MLVVFCLLLWMSLHYSCTNIELHSTGCLGILYSQKYSLQAPTATSWYYPDTQTNFLIQVAPSKNLCFRYLKPKLSRGRRCACHFLYFQASFQILVGHKLKFCIEHFFFYDPRKFLSWIVNINMYKKIKSSFCETSQKCINSMPCSGYKHTQGPTGLHYLH